MNWWRWLVCHTRGEMHTPSFVSFVCVCTSHLTLTVALPCSLTGLMSSGPAHLFINWKKTRGMRGKADRELERVSGAFRVPVVPLQIRLGFAWHSKSTLTIIYSGNHSDVWQELPLKMTMNDWNEFVVYWNRTECRCLFWLLCLKCLKRGGTKTPHTWNV